MVLSGEKLLTSRDEIMNSRLIFLKNYLVKLKSIKERLPLVALANVINPKDFYHKIFLSFLLNEFIHAIFPMKH